MAESSPSPNQQIEEMQEQLKKTLSSKKNIAVLCIIYLFMAYAANQMPGLVSGAVALVCLFLLFRFLPE